MRAPVFFLISALAMLACPLRGQLAFTRPTKRAPGTRPAAVAGLEGLDILHGAFEQLAKNGLPQVDFESVARSLRLRPFALNDWGRKKGARPQVSDVNLTAAERIDVAMLAVQAVQIGVKVQKRMAQRKRELAARGVEEVPSSTAACRFDLDLGALGTLTFDYWGELKIDRRFLTPEDMAVIDRLQAYYRKVFASSSYARAPKPPPRGPAGLSVPESGEGDEIMEAAASLSNLTRVQENRKRKVPIFRGFEDARYQRHDALIVRLTREFNAHKAQWIDGTPEQAAKVADLTPALVKSHMIEETGGNGPMALAAWPVDPEQVNVPGDWSDAKLGLGLKKPEKRNEGTAETNVRAAIKFLARKGFGKSGQATKKRPEGFFDGWPVALQRYNARRDRTVDNRFYSDAYSEKIRKRAENPNTFVPIEIRLAAKTPTASEPLPSAK